MKSAIKRKNVYLDETKIQRARRILGTQSDTDTIDRAVVVQFDSFLCLRRGGPAWPPSKRAPT